MCIYIYIYIYITLIVSAQDAVPSFHYYYFPYATILVYHYCHY